MLHLTKEEIGNKVTNLGLPLLAQAGVDLVELKIVINGNDVMITFLADLPLGGITIAQCSELNKAICEAMDADGFLGENYSLEFSSPGLDRPLQTPKDFLRNMDREIRLELNAPLEGKKEWTGIVSDVNTEAVTINAKHKKHVAVPISQIIKAVLVI